MTHRRRDLLLALPALTLSWPAPASTGGAADAPPELRAQQPALQLQGQARLRYFGLPVYDIRLWSAAPVRAANWPHQALALELVYARALSGQSIAQRSIAEMQRQGPIPAPQAERWRAAMGSLFPDVDDGDRLTGWFRPGAGVHFFLNGSARGQLDDADFARRFAGIWLSAQTSEPDLRARLLAADTP